MASIAYYLYTQLGLAGGPEYGKLAPLTAANSHAHLFLKASWENSIILSNILGMYCETCWRHVISMVPTWCSHQNEACSNFNDFCGHAADQPWVSVKRCVDGSPGCCSYLNTFFFMHCRSLSAIRKRKAARARLSPESSKPTPFRPRPASRGPSLHPPPPS